MAKLQKPVFTFFRFFNKLVKELKTFADDHPTVQTDLERLAAALAQCYQGKDTFSLGRDQDNLVVQEEIVEDKSDVVAVFLNLLKTTRIAKFVLRPGMPQGELLQLIRLMGMKAEDVLKEKRIRPELLQPFRIIKVIEARFVLVTDDQEVVTKTGFDEGSGEDVGAGGAGERSRGPAAGGTGVRSRGPAVGGTGVRSRGPTAGPDEAPTDTGTGGIDPAVDPLGALDLAFDRTLGSAKGGTGGTGAGVTPQAVVSFFRGIDPHLGALEEGVAREKLQHCLNQLLSRMIQPAAGLGPALEAVREVLQGLPDECQQILFGAYAQHFETRDLLDVLRCLDPVVHSGILEAEILAGKLPAEELRNCVDVLAPAAGEFLGLMSRIATGVIAAGGAAEEVEGRMNRLFQLFPGVRGPQDVGRRRVLVLDADARALAGYLNDLVKSGYEVVAEAQGANGLETYRVGGPFACVILDLDLPGADGVEILKGFAALPGAPPVVVTTTKADLRNAPAVASHPNLRFLDKPVEPTDLMIALMDLCPQDEPSSREGVARGEHDPARACEIQQACFVPREIPVLAGFDFAAIQHTAQETSGDYCDLIPLPHGRWGFVIADVSGEDPSRPMVLALVRTLFRSLAPMRVSPKALLKDVNRHLVKGVRRELLVRAVYGALDPAGRVMILANAGYTPPVFRGRKMGSAVVLESPGIAMGLDQAQRFDAVLKDTLVRFEPNDRLVFYSDGVTGAKSPAGEEFGGGRLLAAVNRYPQADAAGLLNGVVQAVEEHRDTAASSDDLTLLVCRHGIVA